MIKITLIYIQMLLVINSIMFTNIHISSGSMENTIPTNSYIVCKKQICNNKPQRLDIVVFRYPLDKEQLYIKRIIGLPGEHIEIRKGKIYINNNNEPLAENYLKEDWKIDNDNYIFDIPDECYLMLGDNRNDSYDNRYWFINEEISNYAYVNINDIVAKTWFQYYPQINVVD